MAAILRLPAGDTPGIVSFTTQERDNAINLDAQVRAAVERLKDRWLVGLHHNWHDYSFRYDPLFDFSFAGEEDLREVGKVDFPVIGLDACNFTPSVFSPGEEPFWDVLFAARAVYFKRIPQFFDAIRTLYDQGHELRVLLLCPMPPYDPAEEKTVFYGIRESYTKLFDEHEQDRFTLLTMDWRYPFPLDLPTLAHFYRSSRVFVHTADDERRCRVAAYAWSSGLPVVGLAPIGSLLSPDLRRPPWFFEAHRDRDFAPLILEAVESAPLADDALRAVRAQVSSDETRPLLIERLGRVAADRGFDWADDGFALELLDIRLGRHNGLGVPGPNRVEPAVAELVATLADGGADLESAFERADPELELGRLHAATPSRRWSLRRGGPR